MRTIKFRAWSTHSDKGHWIHPSQMRIYLDGSQEHHVWDSEWSKGDDGVILMQSTGLFDKNGVEIWEGDVVRGQFQYGDDFGQATGEIEEIIKVVRWDEGMQKWPGFQVGEINFGEFPVEVLGNIYETPELLNDPT